WLFTGTPAVKRRSSTLGTYHARTVIVPARVTGTPPGRVARPSASSGTPAVHSPPFTRKRTSPVGTRPAPPSSTLTWAVASTVPPYPAGASATATEVVAASTVSRGAGAGDADAANPGAGMKSARSSRSPSHSRGTVRDAVTRPRPSGTRDAAG